MALREVIASKAPLETPTQLLLRDIQVRESEFFSEKQEGGGPNRFLGSWRELPSPIKVTLFPTSRRVVGTQRQWPSSTGGTLF